MADEKKSARKTGKGTSQRESKQPGNAGFDDPLFVPHLELLDLGPEGMRAMEGAGPSYSMMFESICGTVDDSQEVEQYDGSLGVTTGFVDAHRSPVAQVQWNDNLGAVFTNPGNVSGVRWGSGTMIGPDLFLTCGHLFDTDINGWTVPRQNGTNNAISPQQAALNMHLNFLYQRDEAGNLRAEQSFPITQLIEYRLGGLDMALCRIGGSPGNVYGWSEFATTNAAVGDMLAIIGHPLGQPKRVEAGPLTQITGSVLGYNDIDTLGGNSGSGILHSPSGRVVGVHTNGGCNSAGTGSNTGVAIAAIIAASPTLQATTPNSRTARAGDVIATHLAHDIGGTLKAADTGIRDQIGTPLAADLGATIRAADVRGTPLAADLLGTPLAGDFGTGLAADDPNNTLREQIFDPGDILIDPVVRRGIGGIGGIRPFVQAGQHLNVAGEQQAGQADPVLLELEALMQQTTAMLESLQAVYQALTGQVGGGLT